MNVLPAHGTPGIYPCMSFLDELPVAATSDAAQYVITAPDTARISSHMPSRTTGGQPPTPIPRRISRRMPSRQTSPETARRPIPRPSRMPLLMPLPQLFPADSRRRTTNVHGNHQGLPTRAALRCSHLARTVNPAQWPLTAALLCRLRMPVSPARSLFPGTAAAVFRCNPAPLCIPGGS